MRGGKGEGMKNKPYLKEERYHGTTEFPCAFYDMGEEGEKLEVKHHWHEELEMIYFRNGGYEIQVGMDSYQGDRESFWFINPGELHSLLARRPCEESAVVFHLRMLNFDSYDLVQSRLLAPLSSGNLALPRMVEAGNPVFDRIKREYLDIREQFLSVERKRGAGETEENSPGMEIPEKELFQNQEEIPEKELFQNQEEIPEKELFRNQEEIPEKESPRDQRSDPGCQILVKAGLLKILGILWERGLFRENVPESNFRMEALKGSLSYVREHYREKIYLRQLADKAGMNEQYFCRFFKKVIGKSPMAYVNEYRVRCSMALLRDTDRTVMEISLECGFHNLGNYLREFRRLTETTPLQYRKWCQDKKSK